MKATILTLFFVFLSLVAMAQSGVIGRMEVEVAVPVTAVETELLNFGKVIPETGGGTVVITPTGDRTATGSITLMDDTYSSGSFMVSGVPSSLVSIVLPQTPQRLLLSNGNSEISVDDFTSDIPPGGQIVRQSDGKAEVRIGATLFIGNGLSNPAGYYSGTYEVVFMYN